jgi:hypothetical protein
MVHVANRWPRKRSLGRQFGALLVLLASLLASACSDGSDAQPPDASSNGADDAATDGGLGSDAAEGGAGDAAAPCELCSQRIADPNANNVYPICRRNGPPSSYTLLLEYANCICATTECAVPCAVLCSESRRPSLECMACARSACGDKEDKCIADAL